MPYFEKTKKLSDILFGMWGIFLLLSIIGFFRCMYYEILFYNLTNDIRGSIFTVVCFVLSLFFLIMTIALSCIIEDVKKELTYISEQVRDMNNKSN